MPFIHTYMPGNKYKAHTKACNVTTSWQGMRLTAVTRTETRQNAMYVGTKGGGVHPQQEGQP